MTKAEFIHGLREALAEAPDSLIIENVNYYSSYIDGEVRKGRSEEAVLAELGEPQWIAKSILDASMGNTRASESAYDYSDDQRSGSSYDYHTGSNQSYNSDYEDASKNRSIHTFDLNKWYVKALLIAIPLLILIFIFAIVGMAFKLALSILFSPIFWGIVIGMIVAGWFFKRK